MLGTKEGSNGRQWCRDTEPKDDDEKECACKIISKHTTKAPYTRILTERNSPRRSGSDQEQVQEEHKRKHDAEREYSVLICPSLADTYLGRIVAVKKETFLFSVPPSEAYTRLEMYPPTLGYSSQYYDDVARN